MNIIQLYNDNIRDLIATSNGNLDQNLRIKLAEHSSSGLVEVDGAIQEPVENAIELLDVFRKGSQSRSTASTKMNADSSRSHLLATMVTRLENKRTGRVTSGKVTLVDLAGSERVGKR
jgi:kinesin family protein C2/C3